jgi:hypothetical protein
MPQWLRWFVININHFTVPGGMFFGLLAVTLGLYTIKKRREGVPQPHIPKSVYLCFVLLVVVGLVMAGMVIARNAS